MARWNEEQDRWMGRGDRSGEDERRLRAERGEEGGWRGRDWRDDDRFGEGWRGSERGSEWGERGGGFGERSRGERYTTRRGGESGREWEAGRGGFGSSGQGRSGERERFGERWSGEGWRGEGAYGEGRGGGSYGGRGDYTTYGSGGAGGGRTEEDRGGFGRDLARYGREEYPSSFGRDAGRYGEREGWYGEREMGRYGRDEDRGLGERMKEGWRKLTGKGPKGYRRSDDRIRDDVSERIARSWVNAENVEVKAENGEVTLSGSVERREDKRMLEDIAEDVFGVVEVHNHLRVSRGQQAAQTATAGTGTTGTGTAMSGQQGGTRPSSTQQGQTPGRH